MPELPEVETIARQLGCCLTGDRTAGLDIFDPKLETEKKHLVGGRRVLGVRRAGKQVCVELSSREGINGNGLYLLFHLRMTGRLIATAAGDCRDKKHLRALLRLSDSLLYFYDLRRFGSLRILDSSDKIDIPGMDPLGSSFTARALESLIAGSRQEIKPWLLRQDRLTGLGNIYASEILFAARIDPRRRACTLDRDEIRRLHRQTRRILRRAIDKGGTTFSDYQDSRGESGLFQGLLAVYARPGLPCPSCGAPVERIVQQQRSTFFCASCQK